VGEWVTADSPAEARRRAARVSGRRSTLPLRWPLDLPEPGSAGDDWAVALQTTWLEPAALEPDAAWCLPGGRASSAAANGGAFGGKSATPVTGVAERLAAEHDRPVLAMLSREDMVRVGAKRPPMAIGLRPDGSGVVRVIGEAAIEALVRSAGARVGLDLAVEVVGPEGGLRTSVDVRGAVWTELAVCAGALRRRRGHADWREVVGPSGARASAWFLDGVLHVRVTCGPPLDPVTLRSYCIGAAHMALGWVRSEGVVVDDSGAVCDLTMRSFGILRALDMPTVEVDIVDDGSEPVNGSDAVYAAVALAAWEAADWAPRWPTMRQ
jgi:xanthine dehydrogenase small subunit